MQEVSFQDTDYGTKTVEIETNKGVITVSGLDAVVCADVNEMQKIVDVLQKEIFKAKRSGY